MSVSYRLLVDRAATLKDLVSVTMRTPRIYEVIKRSAEDGEEWFTSPTYELWDRHIELGLKRATTTAITAEGVSLLTSAADQLPTDLDLFDMRPAVPEGFLVFPERQAANSGPGYDALWWHLGLAEGDTGQRRHVMNITTFTWTPPVSLLPANSVFNMTKGRTLQEGLDLEETHPDTRGAIRDKYDDLRRIVAFNLLVEQRVLQDEDHQPTRQMRRAAERRGRTIDPVRLTRLPRMSHSGSGNAQTDRDYTHRWVVNGHWRNQWYPSMQSHRPKWIAPYIKGPDDKPLVVKDDRFVFDPRQGVS